MSQTVYPDCDTPAIGRLESLDIEQGYRPLSSPPAICSYVIHGWKVPAAAVSQEFIRPQVAGGQLFVVWIEIVGLP